MGSWLQLFQILAFTQVEVFQRKGEDSPSLPYEGADIKPARFTALHKHTLRHKHAGLPQMPGQVPTRPPVCSALTAILQAEGLQGRCYHTGHAGVTFPGPFQVMFQDSAHRDILKLGQP